MFDILPVVVHKAKLSHCPGDQFVEIEQAENYQASVSTRMSRLKQYLVSYHYVLDSILAMTTSIPRWKFAQTLETASKSNPALMKGLLCATKELKRQTDNILNCGNALVEALLTREPYEKYLRLEVYRGLLRTALYVHDKSFDAHDSFWSTLMSDADISSQIHDNFSRTCCSATGTVAKIHIERC